MKRVVKAVRKVVVALIGFPVLVIGIILIPLPGPGILICLLALFILSLEFDWARPYLKKAKSELDKVIQKAKSRQENIDKKYK